MNIKKHIFPALVTLAALSVTACNTIQGVGQDVESVGEKIEETAE